MRSPWPALLVVTLATAWAVTAEKPRPAEFPLYVGKAVCLECHRVCPC